MRDLPVSGRFLIPLRFIRNDGRFFIVFDIDNKITLRVFIDAEKLGFASAAGGQRNCNGATFASAFVPQAAALHAAPNRKRRLNW